MRLDYNKEETRLKEDGSLAQMGINHSFLGSSTCISKWLHELCA